MKHMGLPAVLAVCLFPAAFVAADDAKPDRELIHGTWSAVLMTHGDTEVKPAELAERPMTFKIQGDVIATAVGKGADERKQEMKFQLDVSKSPRQIILSPNAATTKEAKPPVWIYELKGDTLKIAYRTDGEAPADFKPGNGVVVWTLQRQKS